MKIGNKLETEYQVVLVKQCVQHDKAKQKSLNNPELIIDMPAIQSWIRTNANVIL